MPLCGKMAAAECRKKQNQYVHTQIRNLHLGGRAREHGEHRYRPDHPGTFPESHPAQRIRRQPLPRLALRRPGAADRLVPAQRQPLWGQNPRRRPQFRLRQFARARRMGHRRLRVPRRGVELLRRHLPQQCPQQRAAADHRERGVPRGGLRGDRRRPCDAIHRRPGQPDADDLRHGPQRALRDRRIQEAVPAERLRRRGLPAQHRAPDRSVRTGA